ncbi:hypothetical protein TrLO_g2028 [Triparma laevis f. longispina]|uniref:Uncharacterized protein n=1 Tax=Triparma laevis f. longispina TaxID=1714387 RepID=A0A9W7KRN6_9STRA|nr:hypothetical protein TrLO_g2028 [Triparma laevis f. longispina]
MNPSRALVLVLLSLACLTSGFLAPAPSNAINRRLQTRQNLFGDMFEQAGPLGKGITVAQVSVCVSSPSVLSTLNRIASANGGMTPTALSRLASETCLSLLRLEDSWVSASSRSSHFATSQAGKAESSYNNLSTKLASKYEKEYPISSNNAKKEGAGLVVATLLIEMQGDQTIFKDAGRSYAQTRDVLSSVASDVKVDGGRLVNAVEVFWCPGDVSEVLDKRDVLLDFPELIDL